MNFSPFLVCKTIWLFNKSNLLAVIKITEMWLKNVITTAELLYCISSLWELPLCHNVYAKWCIFLSVWLQNGLTTEINVWFLLCELLNWIDFIIALSQNKKKSGKPTHSAYRSTCLRCMLYEPLAVKFLLLFFFFKQVKYLHPGWQADAGLVNVPIFAELEAGMLCRWGSAHGEIINGEKLPRVIFLPLQERRDVSIRSPTTRMLLSAGLNLSLLAYKT